MRIRYTDKDPRVGQIVELEEGAARAKIDAGEAVAVDRDGNETDPNTAAGAGNTTMTGSGDDRQYYPMTDERREFNERTGSTGTGPIPQPAETQAREQRTTATTTTDTEGDPQLSVRPVPQQQRATAPATPTATSAPAPAPAPAPGTSAPAPGTSSPR